MYKKNRAARAELLYYYRCRRRHLFLSALLITQGPDTPLHYSPYISCIFYESGTRIALRISPLVFH